ncbi:presequence translocated-associated motor subunit PAM17 [Lentinula aff. detonsa]|uniref:Presequence translocated-associated motor subunit PAM17 n=1 Tax=Lentinula aff. detonsa TaxID=2804958 RepID=A0AA38ND20_9AGAR|nr:presequence translocated-associated motor subunit PAM17 [Lentinula aff. detonsa]KAJ3796827.1 presequence translocated-associated motor subunit PAM17 [Lentinula aff. detonsa]
MQRTLFIHSLRSFVSARVIVQAQSASRLSSLSLANGGPIRLKSTKAATQKTTPPTFSSASTTSSEKPTYTPPTVSKTVEPLTWPAYLSIRRSKRRWQNFAAIPCSLLGLLGGATYFGSLDTDPMKPIFGIDPFMFYGICTTACMGVGYLVGPTLGAFLWRQLPSSKRYGSLIDKKDKEFYERIGKNRVDVTLQSPTSPVPDYYGERIGSLHEYRKWLRDQNKYRRKVIFDEAA